jgi:hypothetical protein
LATSSPSIVATMQSFVGRSPLVSLGIVLLAAAAVLYVVLRRAGSPRPAPAVVAAAAAKKPFDPVTLDPAVADPATREVYVAPAAGPLVEEDPTLLKPKPRSRPVTLREQTAALAAAAAGTPVPGPAAATNREADSTAASDATAHSAAATIPSAGAAGPGTDASGIDSPPARPAEATEGILPQALFPAVEDRVVTPKPAERVLLKPAKIAARKPTQATDDGLPPMAPPPPKK